MNAQRLGTGWSPKGSGPPEHSSWRGLLTEFFSAELPLESLNALTTVVAVHFVDPQGYDFYL